MPAKNTPLASTLQHDVSQWVALSSAVRVKRSSTNTRIRTVLIRRPPSDRYINVRPVSRSFVVCRERHRQRGHGKKNVQSTQSPHPSQRQPMAAISRHWQSPRCLLRRRVRQDRTHRSRHALCPARRHSPRFALASVLISLLAQNFDGTLTTSPSSPSSAEADASRVDGVCVSSDVRGTIRACVLLHCSALTTRRDSVNKGVVHVVDDTTSTTSTASQP